MKSTSITPKVFASRHEFLEGKDAWNNNLRIVTSAAERLRSSLGPNGAYKMVTYNRGPEKVVKITKDAVAVLEELAIQYPTVAILSEAAKLQRQQIGDGVTSFVIFTSALLKNADMLVNKKVHPTTILSGYHEAAKKAIEIIKANSQNAATNSPKKILETTDCGRGYLTEEICKMLTEATEVLTKGNELNRDKVQIIKKPGGNIWETKFVKGLAIKKGKCHPNMPNAVLKPRIAITSERIGTNRLEVKMPGQGPFHIKVDVETPKDRTACREVEKQQKIDALQKLEKFNVNVLFSQQPIDNVSKSRLLNIGILAFESVDRNDLSLITKVTGTKMVGNLADLTEQDIGYTDNLETEKIGLENIVTLEGCSFATFIIQGSTSQALDEMEMVINNSLNLLRIAKTAGKTVTGGGAIEMQVAMELKKFALQFSGREQLAVDGFAEALMEIPRCLAANTGLFPDDVLIQLNKLHAEGSTDYGISTNGPCSRVCDELAEVKISAIQRAFEVATLMLRIDQQVTSKEMVKFHKKQ